MSPDLARVIALIAALKIGQVGRFGDPGDRLAGGTPACHRRIPAAEYRRKLPLLCAHRTLPCGTPVLLLTPERSAVCYVLDRGPYTRQHGRYRSVLDLSPNVADAIGLTLYIGRRFLVYLPLAR